MNKPAELKTSKIIIFKTEDEKISVVRSSTDRKIGNSDFSIKRTNQVDVIVSSVMTQFEACYIQDTKHIYVEGKLNEMATCRKFRHVQIEGKPCLQFPILFALSKELSEHIMILLIKANLMKKWLFENSELPLRKNQSNWSQIVTSSPALILQNQKCLIT